jgi:hypothetical protein
MLLTHFRAVSARQPNDRLWRNCNSKLCTRDVRFREVANPASATDVGAKLPIQWRWIPIRSCLFNSNGGVV